MKKFIYEFNHERLTIGTSKRGYGKAHFAKKNIKKGQIVMYGFGNRLINNQTQKISIQIAKNRHYLPTNWGGKCWNHSCEPNTYAVNMKGTPFPVLIAGANIKAGSEITYSYWMTEYAWCKQANEKTIKCLCGSKKCHGKILAFSELPNSVRKNLILKNKVSNHLKTSF